MFDVALWFEEGVSRTKFYARLMRVKLYAVKMLTRCRVTVCLSLKLQMFSRLEAVEGRPNADDMFARRVLSDREFI